MFTLSILAFGQILVRRMFSKTIMLFTQRFKHKKKKMLLFSHTHTTEKSSTNLPQKVVSYSGPIGTEPSHLYSLTSQAYVQYSYTQILYLKVYWRTRVAKHSSIATEIVSERVPIEITVQFLDDKFPRFPGFYLLIEIRISLCLLYLFS